MKDDAYQLWLIIAPFATLAVSFYWKALRNRINAIWATNDGFWWKARCSFIAIFTSVGVAVILGFKDFPVGTLINVLVKIIKARLGIPATVKAAKAILR